MLCKNCGSQLDEGSKFCGNCGSPVQNDVNVSATVSNETIGGDLASLNNFEQVNNVQQSSNLVESINSSSVSSNINDSSIEQTKLNNGSELGEGGSKSSKIVLLFFLIILLGVLFAACVCGYYFLFSKKIIVSNLINSVSDKVDLAIDEYYSYDYQKNSALVNGDMSFETNIPDLDVLNSEKISYSLGLDYPSKKLQTGASLSEDGVSIFDFMVYLKDNNLFFSLSDIYESLIKVEIPEDEFSELFDVQEVSVSKDDIKYINKAFSDIFVNSIDMNDFGKSSKTIVLNDVDTKVNVLSYTLDNNNYEKFINSFIDNTLKDEKLLEILSKLSGSDVAYIKDSLNDSKGSDYSDVSDFSIVFDIYTKGIMNEFVGMDINFLELYDIQVRSYNNISDVNVIFGEYKSNFVVKNLGDKTYNVDFTFDMADKSLTGNFSNSYKKVDSSKSENNFKLVINVDDEMFSLSSNYVQTIGGSISDVDVTNSVDYESITEEEMNEIYSKFLSNIQNSKIYNFINTLSGSMYNTEIDTNSDYSSIDESGIVSGYSSIDESDIISDYSFEY